MPLGLVAGSAEDFFLSSATRDSNDVVFGHHVLDDVSQHLAELIERRFLCRA